MTQSRHFGKTTLVEKVELDGNIILEVSFGPVSERGL